MRVKTLSSPLIRALAARTIALFLCGCTSEALVPLKQTLLSERPLTISIKVVDYCPAAGRRHIDFFLHPHSYKICRLRAQIDWDRDGIVNSEDMSQWLGLSHLNRDTILDGYGDLIIYANGIAAAEQEFLSPCPQMNEDTDNDGLTNCEEILARTETLKWDTDGDGLSDYIELRAGLNAQDPHDVSRDLDGDGITSGREVREHTPVDETNNTLIDALKLRYDAQMDDGGDALCYELLASNVPVVNVSNGNLYELLFTEEDDTHLRHLVRKSVVVPRTVASGTILTYRYGDL